MAMAVVSCIVSQNWLPISTVSQAIFLMSCCAAAVTALDFNGEAAQPCRLSCAWLPSDMVSQFVPMFDRRILNADPVK